MRVMFLVASLCSVTLLYGAPAQRKKETFKHPNQTLSILQKDVHCRPIEHKIIDKSGTILHLEKVYYDRDGSGLQILDYAYLQGKLRHVLKSYYAFNNAQQLTKVVRGIDQKRPQMFNYAYDKAGLLSLMINPRGISVEYTYNSLGLLTSMQSSDATINYSIAYEDDGVVVITDHVHRQILKRQFDEFGNIIRETFPQELSIETTYDKKGRPRIIRMASFGEIHHHYDLTQLVKVQRISSQGTLLYEHCYHGTHRETLIGNLGNVRRSYDQNHLLFLCSSPFRKEFYQTTNQHIRKRIGTRIRDYLCDSLDQLVIDGTYDSLGNPAKSNVNSLNELLHYKNYACKYDQSGNLVEKKSLGKTLYFTYDALDRLITVQSGNDKVTFTYDIFGRRLSKTCCSLKGTTTYTYLYFLEHEIAIIEADKPTPCYLRILGHAENKHMPKIVAIETPQTVFAPIYDYGYTIRKCVDLNTNKVFSFEDLDPFATNIRDSTQGFPWVFAGKIFDLETGLIYFGHRYYDPELQRWITPDPSGRTQCINPYVYAVNNPLQMVDANGCCLCPLPKFSQNSLGIAPTERVSYTKTRSHIKKKPSLAKTVTPTRVPSSPAQTTKRHPKVKKGIPYAVPRDRLHRKNITRSKRKNRAK